MKAFAVLVCAALVCLAAGLETELEQDIGRIDCASRRGFGECRSLGPDCTQTEVTNEAGEQVIRVTFPMKQHEVSFPCIDGFREAPLIIPSIVGGDNTKLYSSSVHSVTRNSFGLNVQRVDDVDEPNMQCTNLQLCYVAIL